MLKLSDVPARAFARDSSSRRDEVIAAHAINDARSPMARTNPANRSFSVVFIVVGSRQRNYFAGFRFASPTAFPAPRSLERGLRRLSEKNSALAGARRRSRPRPRFYTDFRGGGRGRE